MTHRSSDRRDLSLWWDCLPGDERERVRPMLDRSDQFDVVIVGAGFTGLWSAYYLSGRRPDLRIAVLEAETAGFGASGRNGGWCSGLLPLDLDSVAKRSSREAALAMQRAAQQSVDEVGAVAAAEGIDARFAKGGYLRFARSPLQADRLQAALKYERAWEQTDDDVRWLDRSAARERLGADGVFGALWSRHCAAVDPARLVRGLAATVEGRGVALFERTPVTRITEHAVTTPYGEVRAQVVVQATEGYTRSLAGQRRRLLPMYSMVIATEPLPPSFWDDVGWEHRDTFNDERRFLVYAQRTVDDRIVFGGRGAPYHLGSKIAAGFDHEPAVYDALQLSLLEFFPQLADAAITHRWGGVLGIPRDWWPSVVHDPATGAITAGGYAGDGVALTNLAGRTVAALADESTSGTKLERSPADQTLLSLPWVGHHSPAWEPEPLRWLGINVGMRLAESIDSSEDRRGRPAVLRDHLMRRLTGH